MQFAARELKSYAEAVSIDDLQEGEVYFTLQFADERMLFPIVAPIVFLGKNLDVGDTDLWYFQDFESYSAGVRYPSATEGDASNFHARGLGDTKHIFEYERALDELMKCSVRRKQNHK